MTRTLKSIHNKRKHYNVMFGTAPDGDIPGLHYCGDYYKFSGYHTPIGDYFGNGSDGDCTITRNTTLPARAYNFCNLTICPGVVVNFCGDQAAILRACGTLCNLGTIDLRSEQCVPAWNATYSTYGYIENKASKGVVNFTCTGGCGGRKASGVVAGAGGGYCEFGQDMYYACGGYPYCCNGGGGASSCSSSSSAQYANNGGNATATSGGAGANGGRDCNGHYAPGGGGGFGWQCGGNGGAGHNNDGNAYYSGGGDGGNGYLICGGNGGCGHPGGNGGCSYCGKGGNGGDSSCGYGGKGGNSVWGNGGNGGCSGNGSSDKWGCEGGTGGCSMYGNGGTGGAGGQGDCEGGKGGRGGDVLGGQYGLILAGRRLYNNCVIGCGGNGGAGGYTPKHWYSTGYEEYGGDGGDGGAGADVKMFYETLLCSGTVCNRGGCGGAAGTSGSGDNYRGNPGCDGGDGQLEIRSYLCS